MKRPIRLSRLANHDPDHPILSVMLAPWVGAAMGVVIALPLQGSAPDRIQYLVITKDIWSLRAGWDGRFANGVVDYLSVRPTETGSSVWPQR